MSSMSEITRPAWTLNNAAAFNHWMRTGAAELPADWIDDGDVPNSPQVSDDLHFLRSTSVDAQGRDEIDRMCDDMIVVDPYELHAPSRRSDKELAAMLAVLDALDTGKEKTQ